MLLGLSKVLFSFLFCFKGYFQNSCTPNKQRARINDIVVLVFIPSFKKNQVITANITIPLACPMNLPGHN